MAIGQQFDALDFRVQVRAYDVFPRSIGCSLCLRAKSHPYLRLFFFTSRRRHTRCSRDWSSDVCSSDLSSCVGFWAIRCDTPEPFVVDALARLQAALAGRYTIEHEHGRGGMATVYLANDLKHHRQVAIKVLKPQLAAALGPLRFVREIEIAGHLAHPHILPMHDSGEAGGCAYYVMPFVEGESLRARLGREGQLPVRDVIQILREIADALAYAHRHEVVHRDIKPDNVLLTSRHAMVMDFGVAKAVSAATGALTLTTEGLSIGTPAYMAPEQAAGASHVDHRADIYALGMVGYETLTGRPPFTAATPQAILAAQGTQE